MGGNDMIPVEHSIRSAQKFSTAIRLELHVIEDDHRFSGQLPFLEMLFTRFLDQVGSADVSPG